MATTIKLSELQAVMGIVQLAKLDNIIGERNLIRDQYIEGLADLGFKAQQINAEAIHNVQSVVFVVPDGIDRDRLVTELAVRGIETTLGTYCLSNAYYYRKKYRAINENALMLEKSTITLPCFNGVEVNVVLDSIHQVISNLRCSLITQ